MKQSQSSTVAIATKLTLLGALLGCSPPVAASPEVCVLAPFLEGSSASQQVVPQALIPISRPTLFLREPLTELRIEEDSARGRVLLWSWQSPIGDTLEGPQSWPLPPIRAGQRFTVLLRPVGTSPGHFATIELVGAGAGRLRDGDQLLNSLAARPQAWRPAIDGLLERGDPSLATALLFASEGPDIPELNALRLLIAQQSCR